MSQQTPKNGTKFRDEIESMDGTKVPRDGRGIPPTGGYTPFRPAFRPADFVPVFRPVPFRPASRLEAP